MALLRETWVPSRRLARSILMPSPKTTDILFIKNTSRVRKDTSSKRPRILSRASRRVAEPPLHNPLTIMPILPGSDPETKSKNIKEIMTSYEQTGMIGTSKPPNKEAALRQAIAIAEDHAKRSKRRHPTRVLRKK